MADIRKKASLPFFAPLKSSFVRYLIPATEYQNCQMQMTRLSILSIFPLSLSLRLSLSHFLSFFLSQFPCGVKFVRERKREREKERDKEKEQERERERER
jgi:hypothetical protein